LKISYNKLFHLLIDNQMKKGELCRKAGISINAIAKMAKGQNLTVDVLARICTVLDCNFDDIMEIFPETSDNIETAGSEVK